MELEIRCSSATIRSKVNIMFATFLAPFLKSIPETGI